MAQWFSSHEQPMGPSARRPSDSPAQHQWDNNRETHPYSSLTTRNNPPQYVSGHGRRGESQTSATSNDLGGRSNSPQDRSRDDLLSDLDVASLMQRHEELQDKYRKVKKFYFDKDAQLQQLQNVLAHQRLSASRTSIDDNEYCSRFQRLDGAINNLAFNIRRDWRQVPAWLCPWVNRNAPSAASKEMTAVGRAAISRWLVDEVFEQIFHPALEPSFSHRLKVMERDLRRLAPPTPTDEEREALQAKIVNWRMTTLDSLQESLQAQNHQENLIKNLADSLSRNLRGLLTDPPPPGLEGSIGMIVELAVGITWHLPMESRDVFVSNIASGDLYNESIMKVETGLPPLADPDDGGTNTPKSNHRASISGLSIFDETVNPTAKKKGMLGSLLNSGSNAMKKTSILAGTSAASSVTSTKGKDDRIRFSTFMAVQVRGKSVLIKAPVYLRE